MSFYQGRNVLVTGGAGSIGSQLAASLLAQGATVTIIDDLSSGRRENVPAGALFVQGDVADSSLVADLFRECRPTLVFHLAAHFAHANSLADPTRDLLTNGVGTLVLLDSAAKLGVKRFLYASSSCVLAPSDGPLAEDSPVGTFETPYAISKYIGEEYARFYARYYELPVTVLRYFNSYGPGDFPGPYRSVIPNFLWLAMNGLPLPITGTGEETRDFTYVTDVCRATLLAGELGSEAFELYHVGSGQEVRILDLARWINEITGNEAGLVHVETRPWDRTSRRLASLKRISRRLGFQPRTGIIEGLKLTWEWLKTQCELSGDRWREALANGGEAR
ncbi:MAG: NAD-dependent epimerase/dehydratase family protein [Betaproteobacteria bacterium]